MPSTGEYLAVDGIFGSRTEGAVQRFRESARLPRSEVVDYEVWKRVVGAEWHMIDSVEKSH